jgi:diacylglycerol kinase family enzyme
MLAMAVGNGTQCGGGFQVAPRALLNDGLLDVMVVHDVEIAVLGTVLSELLTLGAEENKFVAYAQVPSLKIESARPLQLNLDGEPIQDTVYQFEVLPRRLPAILTPTAPVK